MIGAAIIAILPRDKTDVMKTVAAAAAFAAMAVFLAPTFWFFGQPQYQRWKALHALSGLAVLLALVHALPPAKSSMRKMWIAYGALALLAFIRTAHFWTMAHWFPLSDGVGQEVLNQKTGIRQHFDRLDMTDQFSGL